MKIGFFQFSPVFGDVKKNRDRLVEAMHQSDAELLVAPELATSGYFFSSSDQVERMAETVPGPTTEALIEAASATGCTIVTGFPERDGDTVYNSAVVVGPSGLIGTYRKVHLFNREKNFFSPGTDGFFLFELNDIKIGVLICFDHMFPEAARTLALSGAQIICHPSDLVMPEYGQLTSRVRALENRMFWILANRWGTEQAGTESLTYTGTSQVVDPTGKILIRAESAADDLSAVEVDPAAALNKYVTPLNDLLADRKPRFYI